MDENNQINVKKVEEKEKDIEIHCDDGQIFKIQRKLLIKNSPVFKAMFEHDTKEKQTNIVKIQNYDSKIVKKFMEVLSGEDFQNFQDFGEEFESNVVEIFQLADYYQVEELRKLSIQNFYSSLTIQNIRDNYISMDQVFCEELKEKCVDFIKSNFIEVAKSNEWLKFDADFRLNLFQSLVEEGDLIKSGKSNGSLFLEIKNFKAFASGPTENSTPVFSEPIFISGMSWRVKAFLRNTTTRTPPQRTLSFYLECKLPEEEKVQKWACKAIFDLRLCSQDKEQENFERKIKHIFTPQEDDWGYSEFVLMKDLLDEDNGFLKNDKIRLEIDVNVESVQRI